MTPEDRLRRSLVAEASLVQPRAEWTEVKRRLQARSRRRRVSQFAGSGLAVAALVATLLAVVDRDGDPSSVRIVPPMTDPMMTEQTTTTLLTPTTVAAPTGNIGLVHVDGPGLQSSLPSHFEQIQGALIGADDYAVTVVRIEDRTYLWFEELVERIAPTVLRWRVLDEVDISRWPPATTYVALPTQCSVHGSADAENVAVTRQTFQETITEIHASWRASRSTKSFVPLGSGVVCHQVIPD